MYRSGKSWSSCPEHPAYQIGDYPKNWKYYLSIGAEQQQNLQMQAYSINLCSIFDTASASQ